MEFDLYSRENETRYWSQDVHKTTYNKEEECKEEMENDEHIRTV